MITQTPCLSLGHVIARHLVRCLTVPAAKHAANQDQHAWKISQFSKDWDALSLEPCSRRMEQADDVLVRVRAASINPIDLELAAGFGRNAFAAQRFIDTFTVRDPLPICLGRDFSGIVQAVGPAVTRLRVGDEVIGVLPPAVTEGSHATHVVASSKFTVLKPPEFSDEEAAAIPYAGLTALSAISVYAGLNPNNSRFKRVLVLGGTGSVGLSAIAILKSYGADVTATCASSAKDWLTNVSAVDDVIDYSNAAEFESHGGKYDVVINAAPMSAGTIHENAIRCLKRKSGAQYVSLTMPLLNHMDESGLMLGSVKSGCQLLSQNAKHLMNEGICIKWALVLPSQGGMEFLAGMAKGKSLQPVLDQVFPFDQTRKAYEHVAKGHARGKTVIKMPD